MMGSITNSLTVSVPKSFVVGLSLAAAIGFLSGGFTLGVWAAHGFTVPATATGSSASTGASVPTAAGTPTTAGGPFAAGSTFPMRTPVETLAGHSAALARGSKATVVMAMASWCLFCGYEDKWVLPQLAKVPGVAIDIVDVSPQGGIADPGPENPPFSGHDGSGGPLTVTGMETTMQHYVEDFGTLSAPNIHVYVAPQATQSAWNIQSFPTLAFVGAHGKVAVVPNGALTLSQAQADLQQTLAR